MKLYEYILYASMFFWLFPPIRQRGGKYFTYFLILAVADPAIVVLHQMGFTGGNFLMILINFLLLYSIINSSPSFKINIIIVVIIFTLTSILYLLPYQNVFVGYILLHTAIIIVILKNSIIEIFSKSELNIFPFIIILYEAIVITRIIALLTELTTGMGFYYICAVFQMLIAIFFIIFKESNPRLAIQLEEKVP